MLFFSLARRSRTTFGGNLPTSGPGKIWADQLCELQDWLETQDMNLQMQVVDVTDENAIVSVIEKVQVSKFKIFCTKHISTEKKNHGFCNLLKNSLKIRINFNICYLHRNT